MQHLDCITSFHPHLRSSPRPTRLTSPRLTSKHLIFLHLTSQHLDSPYITEHPLFPPHRTSRLSYSITLPNQLFLPLTYLTSHHPPLLITTPHLSSPHLKVPHLSSPHLITLYSTYDLITFIHPSISSHEYLTGNTSNQTSHI